MSTAYLPLDLIIFLEILNYPFFSQFQVSTLVNLGSNYLNGQQEANRWGTEHASIVPYQTFRTKDGYYTIGNLQLNRYNKIKNESSLTLVFSVVIIVLPRHFLRGCSQTTLTDFGAFLAPLPPWLTALLNRIHDIHLVKLTFHKFPSPPCCQRSL